MRIIEIIQGSPEWLEFRRSHIGATDAPVIMGLNPWRSKLQLWEEKVLSWDKEQTDKMKKGQELEKEAKETYVSLTNLCLYPLVLEDEEYPFLSASFDGITYDLDHAVEIKCGKGSYNLSSNGRIPSYYMCQMQHQMMIANLQEIDYFSYSKENYHWFNLKRDEAFIEKMIAKEIDFWNNITQSIPPEN